MFLPRLFGPTFLSAALVAALPGPALARAHPGRGCSRNGVCSAPGRRGAAARPPASSRPAGEPSPALGVSTSPTQVVGELSDRQADALVRGGIPDRRSDNALVDHTMPSAAQLAAFRSGDSSMPRSYLDRIDGAHTGTTDEIIQWAAYKWGFDPRLLRSVAAVETWWHQSFVGNDGSAFGLFQLRIPYHCCKAIAQESAAFDADYYGAILRSYYDGAQTWLNTVSGNGQRYTAGDLWGSVGYWASGRWQDAAAHVYIAKVQADFATQPWLGKWF